MKRGQFCDVCGDSFAGSSGRTTCLWDRVDGQPGVVFSHKSCVMHWLDGEYIFCGGGAWMAKEDQLSSIDRIAKEEGAACRDACMRYREFCADNADKSEKTGCVGQRGEGMTHPFGNFNPKKVRVKRGKGVKPTAAGGSATRKGRIENAERSLSRDFLAIGE